MVASIKLSFVAIIVVVFGIGFSSTSFLPVVQNATETGGEWTQWSGFGLCSVSCGLGSQSRTRACIKLAAVNTSSSRCSGDASECQQCNLGPCPVNGGWSEWSGFGECPVSCGGSTQFRTRKCNNPVPFNGGSNCSGINFESRACNIQPCPVHGGWSDWSCFSICTKYCGNGVQHRNRTCTNPSPSYGGVYCAGNASVERPCNEHPCKAKDPQLPEQCTSSITLNLTESWRKNHNYSQAVLRNSDRGRIDEGRVWFRFTGMAGRMLKNTCPHEHSCGSTGAYWSNGTLPTIVGQTLDITLHESYSQDLLTRCSVKSFTGSVTRCSETGDFVYKLLSAMNSLEDTVCGV